ncbi:hypothetical protein [Streptomyces phaeochromogenes]|uniref:hypothetical protein n=1 Tax=Streptomyces phaeochromogenes TaxID=1923 RepID=UPI002DD8AC0D|nr:hypothetical protein [Streptomyces phaeochromogenes]WRZ32194.1 hypothetical protein OG931_32950 [Streptomyces phaeochromogenes]
MDATTLGSLLVGVGAVVGGVVAYLGKRGENALTGYSSLTEKLQTERDRLERQLAERDSRIDQMSTQRAADQEEISRLRALIPPGGQP